VRLAEPAGSPPAIGQSGFSVSTDGRIAYRAGGAEPRQLTWYDRSGRTLGTAGQPDATLQYPELSPDGQRVLFTRSVQGNLDIWLEDLVRGGMTRFTVDPSIDTVPLWSPDGTRVAFTSNRSGIQNLYVGAPGRADSAEALLESAHPKLVEDWSRDGRFLVYQEIHPKTGRDLWVLPMTGSSRKPLVAVNTSFEEQNGQLSPDVRWLAYETNESGRFEIVVQSFPEGGHKWPVSTGGGVQPRWRADGKELYFIAPDGKLMSASITSTGAAFAAGTPVALFPVRIVSGVVTKSQYAVSRDGRFLINRPSQESMAPITLILNWKPPGT
jgi:Tol biopolymer transport system component